MSSLFESTFAYLQFPAVFLYLCCIFGCSIKTSTIIFVFLFYVCAHRSQTIALFLVSWEDLISLLFYHKIFSGLLMILMYFHWTSSKFSAFFWELGQENWAQNYGRPMLLPSYAVNTTFLLLHNITFHCYCLVALSTLHFHFWLQCSMGKSCSADNKPESPNIFS